MIKKMLKAQELITFTPAQEERVGSLKAEVAYEMAYNDLTFEQACREWDV